MNQLELEKDAGVYIGHGIILTERMTERIGLKMDDPLLVGAYVFDIKVPVDCKFFCFGAAGRFIPKGTPICKYRVVNRTVAECTAFCAFLRHIDPEDKMKLTSSLYHIDLALAKATISKRPTDEDIASLHMKYRDFNRQKGYVVVTGAQQRVARELRALDRRRWLEGDIEPPAERKKALGDSLWRGPRSVTKGDQYLSDKEEDEDLFGGYETESSGDDDEEAATIDGGAAEIDDVIAPPVTKKAPKRKRGRTTDRQKTSAAFQPPLERVLMQMRAKNQRSLQRSLHTSPEDLP